MKDSIHVEDLAALSNFALQLNNTPDRLSAIGNQIINSASQERQLREEQIKPFQMQYEQMEEYRQSLIRMANSLPSESSQKKKLFEKANSISSDIASFRSLIDYCNQEIHRLKEVESWLVNDVRSYVRGMSEVSRWGAGSLIRYDKAIKNYIEQAQRIK